MVDISANQVLAMYNDLQFGASREIKNEANAKILEFLVCLTLLTMSAIRLGLADSQHSAPGLIQPEPAVHRCAGDLQETRRSVGNNKQERRPGH